MNNALQKHEPNAVAVRSPLDMESLFRAAIDKGEQGVAVMERLLVIRRELNAEQAKAAFDRNLAAFQMACPPIVKRKGVPDRNGVIAYKYAPFEDILAIARPGMREHGFSFTLDTDTDSQPNWVIATCKLTHEGGHSEVSRAKFPLGNKTQIMSDTQQYAAALTFASRRVFCNALGLVTSGEDRDGQGEGAKAKGPSSLAGDKPLAEQDRANKKKLVDLLRSIHRCQGYNLTPEGKNAMQQWLWDETVLPDDKTLDDLTGDALAQCVAKVESKLRGAR